jgi:hypothetical protein
VRTSLLGYLEPHNAVLPQITVEIVDDDRIERDPRHGGKFKLLVDKTRETVDSRV